MVRSVSWLTLQPPFATAATSRRANAQMRREFDEMADGFEDALDEVHAKLPGRSKTSLRACGRFDSALDTERDVDMLLN